MDENVQKFRIGIYTVVVLLILAILIFVNSEGWNPSYNVYIKPDRAPGVRVGTPVRKNGILIGRVSLVKTVGDHVELRLAIREGEYVYANETVSIGAESVLGDAGIEVIPKTAETRGQLVSHNSELTEFEIRPNPMELVQTALELGDDVKMTLESFREMSDTIGRAGDGVESLASQVNEILTDDDSEVKKMITDIRRLSVKTELAVDNINTIFEDIVATMQDPDFQENMDEFVKSLPGIFKEVQDGAKQFNEIISGFAGAGEKVNTNLDNITAFTERLGDTGPEVVDEINAGVKDIRALITKAEGFGTTLDKLTETFGNPNGTVGKLFNDDEAYQEALAAIKNAREATEKLNRVSVKLEPLMNDARVLVDKVARDPGGVIRGAFQRRPVGSGYKGTPGSRDLFR